MSDTDLLSVMKGIRFLDGFTDDHLRKIAEVAQLTEFPEDTVIFREGDAGGNIFLIVDGNVSLEICTPGIGCRRIQTVGRGELLGWSPLLDQPRLFATARTLMPTETIQIEGQQLRTLCDSDSELGYQLLRSVVHTLAARLSAVRIQLLDVYGPETSSTR